MTPAGAPAPARAPAPGLSPAGLLRAAAAQLDAAGIATARQDAETLLARVLGTTRLGLYTAGDDPIPGAAEAAFERLLQRRLGHEPVQYLLGAAEFCGVVLTLGPGVFIPRPETEALVDRALALGPPTARVVDVCTGTGAVACALARQRPGWTVWAVERAERAADCARANVRRLGLDARVQVLEGDLFEPLRGRLPAGGADLVVANPPYLAAPVLPTLPAEVRNWEPREALDGGPDGLAVIRRLLVETTAWLRPGGALLVEIGEEQGDAVRALAGTAAWEAVRVRRDFRGCERLFEARRR